MNRELLAEWRARSMPTTERLRKLRLGDEPARSDNELNHQAMPDQKLKRWIIPRLSLHWVLRDFHAVAERSLFAVRSVGNSKNANHDEIAFET